MFGYYGDFGKATKAKAWKPTQKTTTKNLLRQQKKLEGKAILSEGQSNRLAAIGTTLAKRSVSPPPPPPINDTGTGTGTGTSTTVTQAPFPTDAPPAGYQWAYNSALNSWYASAIQSYGQTYTPPAGGGYNSGGGGSYGQDTDSWLYGGGGDSFAPATNAPGLTPSAADVAAGGAGGAPSSGGSKMVLIAVAVGAAAYFLFFRKKR